MKDVIYNYKEDWNSIYCEPTEKPWMQKGYAPVLKDFFENPRNLNEYREAKILDVGCGDGTLCENLSKLGYENVKGIDVSDVIISRCQQYDRTKVVYESKDFINSKFDDTEKYDIIICWFLLHHIQPQDVNKFVANLFDLCNTNGIVIMSFRQQDGLTETNSHFSDRHTVQLYDPKKVIGFFSPHFEILRKNADKELLEDPDVFGDKYPYYVLKMKKTVKTELSHKIMMFKSRYLYSDSISKFSNKESKDAVMDLLNVFSILSKKIDDLPEKDYLKVFSSLFRNVSRYVCRRVAEESKGELKDVAILKMDTHVSMYSATRYRKSGKDSKARPHCIFNKNDDDKVVKSRAYDLFYKYLDFTKAKKGERIYTIHRHFIDNPSLKYIAFSLKEDDLDHNVNLYQHELDCPEGQKFQHERYTEDYEAFLKYLLNGEFKRKTKKSSVRWTSKNFEDYIDNNGGTWKYSALSFSCFNLGVSGFESWGSLMIEGVKSKVEDVRGWFYKEDQTETSLLLEIKNIIFILKKIDYDYYEALSAKRIKIQSIKSAIAALMSRNMSHNLGSHYLTNTKNYFRKRISEVTSSVDDPNTDYLGADYRGNVHLLQYLKERMDFIATVVSGDHYPYGSLNFKAQLFDVLTEDDHGARHGKRTENFLLKYLVFSEKLTRWGHDTKSLIGDKQYYNLSVEVKIPNISEFIGGVNCKKTIYTGRIDLQKEEKPLKSVLSGIELAVPGGLMARHAFFTIIENIVRNSAKHSKTNEDLIVSFELQKLKQNLLISIHDNRKAGEKVKNDIESRYKNLIIVKGDDNSIDKESKGLKEMLICAIWLRNEDVAKQLYEIQSTDNKTKKLNLIERYIGISNDNEGNLCYTIEVPLYETCHRLEKGIDYLENGTEVINLITENIVNLHSDIVFAEKDFIIDEDQKRCLSNIFPRFVALDEMTSDERCAWNKAMASNDNVSIFQLQNNCSSINNAVIFVEYPQYGDKIITNNDGKVLVRPGKTEDDGYTIFFKSHFDSDSLKIDKEEVVKRIQGRYLESVSGENFTSTIATYDFLNDPVNRYKVIEAANTKIAIIDERIFGDYKMKWKDDVELEKRILEMRGLYLYNFDDQNKNLIQLDGKKISRIPEMDFVTIHLGLVEKYKGRKKIMNYLRDKFGDINTFYAIHSGRGNFSPELEEELRNYPFISLSALEAAFYDCKLFLTQLFKNTNYYGKGNFNNE